MSSTCVAVEHSGQVLTITLHDARTRNAIDDAGFADLDEALRVAADDEGIRAIHLRGAGGSFCSGANVTAQRRTGHPLARMRWLNGVADRLRRVRQPVVCEVDGDAVGAGLGLVLHSDLVVASRRSRFSAIFVKRALSPDFGVAWGLSQAVGATRARRMCLTGEIIDAETALDWGLIGWAVSEADLPGHVRGLLEEVVAGPRVALEQTKMILQSAATGDWLGSLNDEAAAVPINLATDALEAREAFRDRRPPQFDGRWKA